MSQQSEKRCRFRNKQKEQHLIISTRRQAEHQACIAKFPLARILYLILDIGKNVNVSRADTADHQVVCGPRKYSTTRAGYWEWSRQVHELLTCGRFDCVILVHEPTGIYHEAWARQILSDFAEWLKPDAQPRLIYRMLNTYQVKVERTKLVQRTRKSDEIDLLAMRSLVEQGLSNPIRLPTPEVAALNQLVALMLHTAEKLKACRIDLCREFDHIWPGAIVNVQRFCRAHPDLAIPTPIVDTKPFERATFRTLLEFAPDPYLVRSLGIEGITTLLRSHNVRCGPKTAQHILECANQALPPPAPLVAVYRQGLEQLRQDEKHWLDRQKLLAAQLDSLIQQTPARILLSINGISSLLAAYYLSLVGSPPYFEWADQVWSYVGFDPVQCQSGDSNPNRHFRISRHGEAFYRHVLTWMACLVAGHHPRFGLTFVQAEQRGLGLWGAAIHTAHRLNRVCYRMLLDQRPFQDPTSPEDVARWRTYWLDYRRYRKSPTTVAAPSPWVSSQVSA